MIIYIINIMNTITIESENDPIILVHLNAPEVLQISR